MLHLLVSGCSGGRGYWCGRAFAIIRERNWPKVFVRILLHQPVFRLFALYFLSMDFADIVNLGGWVTNSREHRVTCAHGTRRLCAGTYHSAPPCLRCNVAIQVYFSLSGWKFRLLSRLQQMTSLESHCGVSSTELQVYFRDDRKNPLKQRLLCSLSRRKRSQM